MTTVTATAGTSPSSLCTYTHKNTNTDTQTAPLYAPGQTLAMRNFALSPPVLRHVTSRSACTLQLALIYP